MSIENSSDCMCTRIAMKVIIKYNLKTYSCLDQASLCLSDIALQSKQVHTNALNKINVSII